MNESNMIFVARGETDLGMFSVEFATECLSHNLLRLDDLAYTEGLADWMPLGQLLGIEESEPSAPSEETTNRLANQAVNVVTSR